MMLPAAANAENPAGNAAPQTVSLQCSTSNATVTQKTVLGKVKFEHKALVSITTGESFIPPGTVINYSVNGYQPKTYKVDGELGIPPFKKKALGWYILVLDEKEPWPDGCSALFTVK